MRQMREGIPHEAKCLPGCISFVAAALLSLSVGAESGLAVTRWFYFTAPSTNAPPAAPDTACGFSLVETAPLTDLREVRLKLVRFDMPGDTLTLSVPAVGCEGDSMAVAVDLEPGIHFEAMATAVDTWGNESCLFAHYVDVIPAMERNPGLDMELFDNSDLTGFKLGRAVANVDFDWDYGSPDSTIGPDTFSTRLTGFIESGFTGDHTFICRVEDGDSLRVGSVRVISDWAIQNEHERSGSVFMQAGVRYPFQLDYFHNNGTAMLRLDWIQPGQTRRTVPAEAFSR